MPYLVKLMNHIAQKWGRDDEKLWISHPDNNTLSMQITNDRLTIWARALLHNKNPEIDYDHPPTTKDFNWIKCHTPLMDELYESPSVKKIVSSEKSNTQDHANKVESGRSNGRPACHLNTPAIEKRHTLW